MLEKLISAVITKNGVCSSSDINSCSVRVHDNPLLSDCIVGRRLISDLELGLQDKRADILSMLNDSVRTAKYGEAGARHVSAAYLFNNLAQLDDELSALHAQATSSEPPVSSAQAPDTNTNS